MTQPFALYDTRRYTISSRAIAQWKFNALAKKFPNLADIIEDAKKLIGSTASVPVVGMTVSEVVSQLTEMTEKLGKYSEAVARGKVALK